MKESTDEVRPDSDSARSNASVCRTDPGVPGPGERVPADSCGDAAAEMLGDSISGERGVPEREPRDERSSAEPVSLGTARAFGRTLSMREELLSASDTLEPTRTPREEPVRGMRPSTGRGCDGGAGITGATADASFSASRCSSRCAAAFASRCVCLRWWRRLRLPLPLAMRSASSSARTASSGAMAPWNRETESMGKSKQAKGEHSKRENQSHSTRDGTARRYRHDKLAYQWPASER